MLPMLPQSDKTAAIDTESTHHLFWALFNNLVEGGMLLDYCGRICEVTPSFSAMTGLEAAFLKGRLPVFFKDASCESVNFSHMLHEARQAGRWSGELFVQVQNKQTTPVDVLIVFVRNQSNLLEHFLVQVADVSERKSDKAWVRFHANYDLLTRLPNRHLLIQRLDAALKNASDRGRQGGVLLLNLDRFKIINDTFGYAIGDELLRLVAQRLGNCVGIEGSLGRLGGDEFLVILPEMKVSETAAALARRIQHEMQTPFFLGVSDQFCQVSIGVAIFPDGELEANDIVRNAGVAMRASRRETTEPYAVYSTAMSDTASMCLNLENDLRHASSRGELDIFYQPKVCSESLTVRGAEALLRWQHPIYGSISPAHFIPLAEETGLIVSIGRWVLQRVCQQMSAWQKLHVPVGSISVNVSLRQFQDREFTQCLRSILEETKIDPKSLDLEITESVMSGDMARTVAALWELKGLGVTLSVDDFGTGYSSLNWIKGFPIDTLKIDRTFVHDLDRDSKNVAIVSAIVTLAQSLGFDLVAEGIEKEVHATFLHEMGCKVLQGFLFSKPLPPADFVQFIRKHKNKRKMALSRNYT